MRRFSFSSPWTQSAWLRLICCSMFAAVLMAVSWAAAQEAEDDPFGGGADKPAAADEDPAAEPEAAKPEAKAADKPVADDQGVKGEEEAEPEPAVQAVLESKPQTPADLVRAVDILVRLANGKLAEPYVAQLQAAKLDGKAMAALVDRFGSATFLRLTASDLLTPESAKFFSTLLTGAETYRRDPARLTRLVKELSSPNTDVRQEAAIDLALAHDAAVAPLIQALADPQRSAEHKVVQAMLLKLGDDAIPALIGVLESDDQNLKAVVVSLLGDLTADEAVPRLVAPHLASASAAPLRAAAGQALLSITGSRPRPDEGRTLLVREIQKRIEQSRLPDSEATSPVVIWHWDATRRESAPHAYEPRVAAIVVAVRLAHDLHQLDPPDAEARRLYLKLLLHEGKLNAGLARPLSSKPGGPRAMATAAGPDVIEDVLVDSMATGFFPAAAAAAEILGTTGSPELLTRTGAAPSPLVQAVASPDRRLRFAAMDAILRLKPTQRFAGSNHVTDALDFFAGSVGLRRAVVAHPRGREGARIAGFLSQLGFEPDLATNGRQLFQLAKSSPDHELALLHMSIERPAMDELLVQLRRDRRTAMIPIAIVADTDSLERAESLASAAGNARVIPSPSDARGLKLQLDVLTASEDAAGAQLDERIAQATRALEWLVILSDQPTSLFDLRRVEPSVLRALEVPALSVKAALVLANLGTVQSQRALVSLANRSSRPLEMRQAAAIAFGRAVGRHRILLTSQEIMQQYDRYNASEVEPTEVQAVLGSILDVIEGRSAPAQQPKKAPAKAQPERK